MTLGTVPSPSAAPSRLEPGFPKPFGLEARQAGLGKASWHFSRNVRRVAVLLIVDCLALSFGVGGVLEVFLTSLNPTTPFPGLSTIWAPLFPGIIGLFVVGAYRSGQAWLSFLRLGKAGLLAGVIIAWPGFWVGQPVESLLVLGGTSVALVLVCGLFRSAIWVGLDLFGYRVIDQERVVIVGSGRDSATASSIARIESDSGFQVLHVLNVNGVEEPVPGDIKEILWMEIGEFAPDTLIVVGSLEKAWFEGVLELAALTGLRLLTLPRAEGVGLLKERVIWRGGGSYLELTSPALKGGQILIKRLMDIMGSGLGLVMLSPLFAVLSFLVRLDSPGPVFFTQSRVGQGGKLFKILKFRTMSREAEERKSHLQHLNHSGDPRFFKIPDDPRVTPAGKVLRRWSLDELPQLWNVFRGDMSLVGPRPFPLSDLNGYRDHHYDRLAVKPGITGLWQVAGRSRVTSFEDVVRLDRQYIDTWTLGLDLAILLRTLPAVLHGRGAH